MTRKKNKFFTFCFSLIPGAGEMYLGFFRQGISLMVAFFLITAFSRFIGLPWLSFLAPVIWFYSFFHTHNLNSMPDDEFYALEDDFLFNAELAYSIEHGFWNKYQKILAGILIFFGFSILWNVATNLLNAVFQKAGFADLWILRKFEYAVPQFIVAAGIIAAGFYLIRNKKEELNAEGKKEDVYLLEDGNKKEEG